MSDPIILTLALDAVSQAAFDALRTRYFPPARLVVGAHVTMFHALPGDMSDDIAASVRRVCAATPAFGLRLGGVRFLGRGVALDLLAGEALALRACLRARFEAVLGAQDRAPWRPHVTVQNKVSAETARETWRVLQDFACAAPVRAEGVAVWRYRGGPWEAVETCRLAKEGGGGGGGPSRSPQTPRRELARSETLLAGALVAAAAHLGAGEIVGARAAVHGVTGDGAAGHAGKADADAAAPDGLKMVGLGVQVGELVGECAEAALVADDDSAVVREGPAIVEGRLEGGGDGQFVIGAGGRRSGVRGGGQAGGDRQRSGGEEGGGFGHD